MCNDGLTVGISKLLVPQFFLFLYYKARQSCGLSECPEIGSYFWLPALLPCLLTVPIATPTDNTEQPPVDIIFSYCACVVQLWKRKTVGVVTDHACFYFFPVGLAQIPGFVFAVFRWLTTKRKCGWGPLTSINAGSRWSRDANPVHISWTPAYWPKWLCRVWFSYAKLLGCYLNFNHMHITIISLV